jgi:hypothetical protein
MKKLHRIWQAALTGVVLYVAVYVVLSLLGKSTPSQSGRFNYPPGHALTDIEVWRPKFVWLKVQLDPNGVTQTSANFLGWLFLPLELLDRRYWHPTQPYFEGQHATPKETTVP